MKNKKVIQFPLEGVLRGEFNMDECLCFYIDGTIESNGGHVDHHEIEESDVELLPTEDQEFVREFLKDPQRAFLALAEG